MGMYPMIEDEQQEAIDQIIREERAAIVRYLEREQDRYLAIGNTAYPLGYGHAAKMIERCEHHRKPTEERQ